MPETVMIVTGETSGELYGSLLAISLKRKLPGIRITGIGGERMKAAGVELIAGISGSFGLIEAISSIRSVRETFKKAAQAFRNDKPNVLVLIDYPDFNLRLAHTAKKENIRILYYVSPQVWAWRKKRVKKIAGLVDKMAVVLPFEAEIYKDTGLECEFVGHPVFDEIQEIKKDKNTLKKELGLVENLPLLSLLPGSRPSEIDRLLPVIVDITRSFRKNPREFQLCVPFAPNTDIRKYNHITKSLREEGVIINKGKSLRILAASDIAVVASGTASLQSVLLGVPTVVIYKLSPITYFLGKLILNVQHISLVNIISERGVIKELLQDQVTTRNIIDELDKITNDSSYKADMLRAFDKVREMFSGKRASERVADIVIEMAGMKEVKNISNL
jgi:lipid-A-disaccharide synthase